MTMELQPRRFWVLKFAGLASCLEAKLDDLSWGLTAFCGHTKGAN
jgi:hypothetical protein